MNLKKYKLCLGPMSKNKKIQLQIIVILMMNI